MLHILYHIMVTQVHQPYAGACCSPIPSHSTQHKAATLCIELRQLEAERTAAMTAPHSGRDMLTTHSPAMRLPTAAAAALGHLGCSCPPLHPAQAVHLLWLVTCSYDRPPGKFQCHSMAYSPYWNPCNAEHLPRSNMHGHSLKHTAIMHTTSSTVDKPVYNVLT